MSPSPFLSSRYRALYSPTCEFYITPQTHMHTCTHWEIHQWNCVHVYALTHRLLHAISLDTNISVCRNTNLIRSIWFFSNFYTFKDIKDIWLECCFGNKFNYFGFNFQKHCMINWLINKLCGLCIFYLSKAKCDLRCFIHDLFRISVIKSLKIFNLDWN